VAEGAVFQRSDGYWVGRVELGRSPTGRRLRAQVVRRTKQSVLNGLKELQRQAEAGVASDKTRTVMQYLQWWLENVGPETVSPDTLVDYRWQLEHYVIPHVDHISLAKLTPADVQKMLRSLEKAGYSPRTREYARAILRRALSWAEGTGGILLRNAAALVDGPKKRESKPNGALAPLGLPLDERGRALVDSSLRVEGRTNVWALGDCAAALDLQVRGVSDFESIDRTWMITLQTGLGPFGMMDRMGLAVVHHVATLLGAHDSTRYLDDEFIRQGRLGVASGRGFYGYPNPAFAQPDFT
jgi:3-hydroxyacyl-CoA dehydrogenase, C-terminal domain/Phage integrase, N-terminal SAM-like domain